MTNPETTISTQSTASVHAPQAAETPRPTPPPPTANLATDDLSTFAEKRNLAAEAGAKRLKASKDELARIEEKMRKIRALAKAQEREFEDKRRDASTALGALAVRALMQALPNDEALRRQIDARLITLSTADAAALKKLTGLENLSLQALAKLLKTGA